MTFTHAVRQLFWKLGYDISYFTPALNPVARRKHLFKSSGIDLVLDVGANAGQFVEHLRDDLGYCGRIVSFEPMRAAFSRLDAKAKKDPRWTALNMALGEACGGKTIHVAGNSYSSSILEMLPAHLEAAPESGFVAEEEIDVRTLDSMLPQVVGDARNIYLKIDTQGYEQQVLKGGRESLSRIGTIQLEMSLVPLYGGELAFGEMYQFMAGMGYRLIGIEEGFADGKTGKLLQVDGTFQRG